jgi:hypothetical protein
MEADVSRPFSLVDADDCLEHSERACPESKDRAYPEYSDRTCPERNDRIA